MAGNSRSGRRPSQLDARERLDPSDVPTKPSGMAGFASEFWESDIAPAVHLTRSDTSLAIECCRQFDLYRQAIKSCERIPLDDEAARTAGKHFDRWVKLLQLLSLDTVGRIRSGKAFRRDKKEEQVSKEEQMFGVVG